MNAVKFVTAALFTLLAVFPAMAVKYMAIVETDVDAASGASNVLNSAEIRQITAELRRQATENLPSDKYSVITSETVQSMGGAVLEECAEENCVITLGAKIGADYIVRGTISKFQTKLTLTVELYETDNGTLVVTSEPVRSENPAELLELGAASCANMFRKFAGVKGMAGKSKSAEFGATSYGENTTKPNKRIRGSYLAPKYQIPLGTPVSWGGINLECGNTYMNGLFWGIGADYGSERDDHSFQGGGYFNLGHVYDLWKELHIHFKSTPSINASSSDDTVFFSPRAICRDVLSAISSNSAKNSSEYSSSVSATSISSIFGEYFIFGLGLSTTVIMVKSSFGIKIMHFK